MTFTGPAIHVQDLVKVYRGAGGKPVRALDGLTEYRSQKVIDLSGGLKRRVQVAKGILA